MKYTPNYKLKKPELSDRVKIDDLNSNMDIIDTELGKKINVGERIEGTVVATAHGFIGWERNMLFNALDRFSVSEFNAKVSNLNYLFNGENAPTSTRGFNKENPYILLIENLPNIHTQGTAVIGWISRYWIPKHFKIEIYNIHSGANTWETVSEVSNNTLPYFYSKLISGSVNKIRFTVYETNSKDEVGDSKLQLGQVVFIHPEACGAYDNYLAKKQDIPTKVSQLENDNNFLPKGKITWNDLRGQ